MFKIRCPNQTRLNGLDPDLIGFGLNYKLIDLNDLVRGSTHTRTHCLLDIHYFPFFS